MIRGCEGTWELEGCSRDEENNGRAPGSRVITRTVLSLKRTALLEMCSDTTSLRSISRF